MPEENSAETESFMRRIERIVRRVAKEENFEVADLPATHSSNLRKCDIKRPMRCVDERSVVEEVGGHKTGYTNTDYNGMQIPGATPGSLDILRKTSKLSEPDARRVISTAVGKGGLQMGAHSDNEDGQVNDINELRARRKGCGDQAKKADGLLPMYKGIVQPHEIAGRLDWLSQHNAPIIPLGGKHTANVANINLNPVTTNDNAGALKRGRQMFNCDLGVAAGPLADSIYDALQESGLNNEGHDRETFRKKFAENTARNFLQTLSALGAKKKIHISR